MIYNFATRQHVKEPAQEQDPQGLPTAQQKVNQMFIPQPSAHNEDSRDYKKAPRNDALRTMEARYLCVE